jgi:enterochelin esterase family protein
MHVYTPPGYESGNQKYPVLYLIHGGGDEDSGWSTIGRTGFILDNLLASNKIKPMIVVMPNGSISLPGVANPMGGGRPATPEAVAARVATISKLHDAFVSDLLTGIIPHVEQTYRVLATRENRAIVGLSMGGAETLRAASSNLYATPPSSPIPRKPTSRSSCFGSVWARTTARSRMVPNGFRRR